MTYEGLDYRGNDIFDENDPIPVCYDLMSVYTAPTGPPQNRIRVLSFDIDVLETSPKQPLSSYDGAANRLWLGWVKNQGVFLFRKCNAKKTMWSRMVAMAKIEEHILFREALLTTSTLRSICFYLAQFDDAKLSFAVYLHPKIVVAPDVDSLLHCNPSRIIDGHDLTFLLRMFNLIDGANYYCNNHEHDPNSGNCLTSRRTEGVNAQTSQTIQKFFDKVRSEMPASKMYALRTEKLTARLRPYQRDAVRFMIDRELHPGLRFHLSWFYYHIKFETDDKPMYYLPNLASFVSTLPVAPTLSICGGILADEMGLGKTVELLALITTLTPDHTPELVDSTGDTLKMDDVREVVDDLISNVVAAIEGEKAVTHFKTDKKEIGVRYYSKSSFMPASPTKRKLIVCEECGTSCLEQRVHWSPGLSAQTRFICPECIMTTNDLIPIKATLVILPQSIAHQWYEEIRRHVKDDVKIDVYKGVSIDGYKHPHYLNQFDIVITTYDVITKEKSFLEFHNPHERLRKRTYEIAKSACTPLFSVLWWRVCLDESQMVERGTSTISSMCKELKARARWSITGTPISSSIKDLYGLVNFLGLSGLDREWIFDQCLYIPFITKNNIQPLIMFMAKIMWRTEKKHLETSKIRVISHAEMVTLSPMEERMYSDLLMKSKVNVLAVVNNINLDRKLTEIGRHLHYQLLTALSKVQLFLLTSLTGGHTMRRKNEHGNEVDDYNQQSTHFSRMFTPASLFRRLLREKKIAVSRGQREVLMHWNGIAAILWQRKNYDKALESYTKAVNLMLMTGPLNENIGQSNAVVFTTKDEDKEDDEEKEGKIGKAISNDSCQFVHIYRNVQWLMNTCPELVDKCEIDMAVMTRLFHQAWRTYSRVEEVMFKEKELEWEEVRRKVIDCNGNFSSLIKWIDNLDDATTVLDDSEGKNWAVLELKLEKSVGYRFSNVRVMVGWMKNQLNVIKSLSQDIVQLIDRCIEISNRDDMEDEVSEGRYRMSDLPMIVKSPKKDKKDIKKGNKKEEENVPNEIEPRRRGLKKKVVEIKTIDNKEEYGIDLMKILELNNEDLYDNCVICLKDGEFDDISQESCLFCATQAVHQIMQLKDDNGKPSRSRVAVLELLEKEFTTLVLRDTVIEDEDKDEWKFLRDNWNESITIFTSLDSYWRSLLIVILEKMNRVRELRQCTIRSEREEGLEDEERKMNRAKTIMDKLVHNLKYVYTLREESGIPSSSVLPCTNPSSRECPICFDEIGEAWFVFPCAHLNCGKCFNRLVKLQGANRVSCSVCRAVYTAASVLYVSNKKNNADCPVDSLNLNVKLDRIVRLTVNIMKQDNRDKILVFTSLSMGFAALKSVFTRANLPFLSLDSNTQHNAVTLSKFRNDTQTKILLLTCSTGGKGLNLTVANHIIFADIVDDMSLEKQAIGRCDRIGQKKDVHVYYVLAQDTVDERMYNLTRKVTSTNYKQDDNWTIGTLIDLFTEL